MFCYSQRLPTDISDQFHETTRKENTVKNQSLQYWHQAEFEQPDASIAAIDYHSGRKLNKALIRHLAACEYITEYRNVFITGATGRGKTYMTCAFGMEACKHYYTVCAAS